MNIAHFCCSLQGEFKEKLNKLESEYGSRERETFCRNLMHLFNGDRHIVQWRIGLAAGGGESAKILDLGLLEGE